jgi:hypothetical protein
MPSGNRSFQDVQRSSRQIPGLAALVAMLPFAANADTLATFDWVPFQNGGSGSGSGDLVLALPGTVSGPGFDVAFASVSAAKNAVEGFSYTFSNGDALTLANLQGGTLQMNPTDWLTTNTVTPAGAPTGRYLGTNFNFSGFVTPAGGVLTPFQLASSGGMVTLGAGDSQLRITDTGYWKLDSLNPVPLPAAAWLLISGLAGIAGLGRGGSFMRGAFGRT